MVSVADTAADTARNALKRWDAMRMMIIDDPALRRRLNPDYFKSITPNVIARRIQ
jgi:hypothetical protein